MGLPAVSIIIPVYNREYCLSDTVKTVQAQTWKDWELLLVDDGSKDGSGALCDELASQDVRIRAIHQENGGVSKARNAGLQLAKADRIVFVDADDILYPDALSEGMELMNRFDLDIVLGGTRLLWSDPSVPAKEMTIKLPEGEHFRLYTHKDSDAFIRQILTGNAGSGYAELNGCSHQGPCSRIYKRELIQDICFPEGIRMGEDTVFNSAVFAKANRIGVTDSVWYGYVQNPRSVTKQADPDLLDNFISSLPVLCAEMEKIKMNQQAWGEYILTKINTVTDLAVIKVNSLHKNEKVKRLQELLAVAQLQQAVKKLDFRQLIFRRKILYFLVLMRAARLLLLASNTHNSFKQ